MEFILNYPQTMMIAVVFLIFAIRFILKEKLKFNKYELLFCLAFSAFIIISKSFLKTGSIDAITNSTSSIIMTIVNFILLSLLSIESLFILKHLFKFINQKLDNNDKLKDKKIIKVFLKHPFIISFLLIIALWTPYIVIRFPLVSEWDAYHQILEGFGLQSINPNWPIASTYFFSTIIDIGKNIFGSYNAGGLLLVIIQTVICASCFAYSMKTICKLNIHSIYKISVLLIYCIATIYPRYLTAIVKDALFASFVVLVLSMFVDVFVLNNNKNYKYVLLSLATFLMCILRSNGIFIVLFLIIGLAISSIKSKKIIDSKLLVSLIVVLAFYKGYGLCLNSFGIKDGSIAEALSIPFQQTARFVKQHEDDVTNDEKEIIDKVLDYDNLAKLYNSKISDPVKATYHGDTNDLTNYFKVWFVQFFKHPLLYFSATFDNTFEYFYPGAKEEESGIYSTTNNDVNYKLFDEKVRHNKALEKLKEYITNFEKFPIVNIFCDCGISFWIIVLLFTYAISVNNRKAIFILIPSVVGILVCVASPTFTWNGIRYAIPVIYSVPISFLTLLHIRKEDVSK